MPLSAQDLQSHVLDLSKKVGKRHVSRLICYSANAFYAILSGEGVRRLSLVLSDDNPRLYAAPDSKDVNSLESPFADLLRKEMSNAYLTGLETVNEDRVVRISLTIINNVYKEEGRSLYFELIPHHANLILCDEDDKVIAAYRPGSLEDVRPLLKGMTYVYPPKKDFVKKNGSFFDEKTYENQCLLEEKELDEKRKKDRYGYLFEDLKRKERLLLRKRTAVEGDVAKAKEHLNDGAYGDYIFMNAGSIDPRSGAMDVDGVSVPLDPSRSASVNAQIFYKRAKKSRGTVSLGEKNLSAIDKDLEGVKTSLSLLSKADEEGLETLAKSWGLEPLKREGEKKKPSKETNRLSADSVPYEVDYKGTKILFGRSAMQNDVLTFLLDTSRGHAWLHVNGTTGSHVMIKKEKATDEEIRVAAEICLINSSLEEGEVILAERADVRKGRVPGQAIVKKFAPLRLKEVRPSTKELLKGAKKATL